MSDVTLDLIGQIVLELRGDVRNLTSEMREVKTRMASLEERVDTTLNAFRDEVTVTSAMVMRYSTEHIAWSAMERQVRALNERLARVESRLPAAE